MFSSSAQFPFFCLFRLILCLFPFSPSPFYKWIPFPPSSSLSYFCLSRREIFKEREGNTWTWLFSQALDHPSSKSSSVIQPGTQLQVSWKAAHSSDLAAHQQGLQGHPWGQEARTHTLHNAFLQGKTAPSADMGQKLLHIMSPGHLPTLAFYWWGLTRRSEWWWVHRAL